MKLSFPSSWSTIDTVLAHDWLTGMRGGERVLELLCRGFSHAPIFTLIHHRELISETINQHEIHTSWLQHVPGIMRHYRYWLRTFPETIERMKPPEADLLISSSHCVAKGLIPRKGTKHICYCHTPMRYAWTFYEEYFGTNPLKKAVLDPMLRHMRDWDKRTSDRVDAFVANSHHVQKRIEQFYNRESDVVYPPIDTERYVPADTASADFDLIVSALVPYKRVDLAVNAYTKLGYPLRVIGVGTQFDQLKSWAGSNIEFLGWQSDDEVLHHYQQCRHLIFPGEEDFGMVPVEAQACGRPVIAYGKGGALESVVEGQTGVFFEEQTAESLLGAVEQAAGVTWDAGAIRQNAERFGMQAFVNGMDQIIRKTLGSS